MRNDEVVRLFDLYANDLFRFALSYLGSKQDSEDVVQDVFLKLLSKSLLLIKDHEKAYLMKMTSNACKNLLNSSARKTGVDLDLSSEELACTYDFNDDDIELFGALMKLDVTYRLPVHLFYFNDYSYKEIAKVLNLSESAVAMRIKRGREQLRELLEN